MSEINPEYVSEYLSEYLAKLEKQLRNEAAQYMDKATRLGIKKLDPTAVIPTKAHMGDLGLDLYALEDTFLASGVVTKVRTGIACEFPSGYGALIRDRSSIATKQEIFVVAGVIDNGYTGEILVAMFNPSIVPDWRNRTIGIDPSFFAPQYHKKDFGGSVTVKKGDKIAQMILTPVVNFPIVEVTDLHETSRGDNGFGSTGQ